LQELRQRIRDSYEARWKAEKHFDEDQILNEMPGSLRIEVSHACLLTASQHAINHYGPSHVMSVCCIVSLTAASKCVATCKSVAQQLDGSAGVYAHMRRPDCKCAFPGGC